MIFWTMSSRPGRPAAVGEARDVDIGYNSRLPLPLYSPAPIAVQPVAAFALLRSPIETVGLRSRSSWRGMNGKGEQVRLDMRAPLWTVDTRRGNDRKEYCRSEVKRPVTQNESVEDGG